MEVVISPEVRAVLDGFGRLRRGLLRKAIGNLGRPADFAAMRPLLGRKHWYATDIAPYVVTCRLLTEREAKRIGATFPALYVATLDRRDMLGDAAAKLIPDD